VQSTCKCFRLMMAEGFVLSEDGYSLPKECFWYSKAYQASDFPCGIKSFLGWLKLYLDIFFSSI